MKTVKIEISTKTIFFTIFLWLFLKFFVLIKEIILSLFISFIISGALKPAVNYLENKKIPRSIASLVIYFLFVVFFILNVLLIFPPLIKEINLFFKQLPDFIKPFLGNNLLFFDIKSFSTQIPNLANDLLSIIKGLFSNLMFIITTLFFSFYLTLDKNFLKKSFQKFFEDNEAERLAYIINQGEKRAASWFWGELMLMFIVGLLTYFGLILIGMSEYALPLAFLAGLLEIVPNLGPIFSAVPAILIGLSQSVYLGVYNLALYIVVQQLENNLIVPLVMKKVIGIHPIVTLLGLLIGGKLAGVLGALLAVPIIIFLETIILEWQKRA